MSRFAKTHVHDLQLGMFVADLDRPWIDTPFMIQGFTINSADELRTLQELCTWVDVDVGLSRPLNRAAQGRRGRIDPERKNKQQARNKAKLFGQMKLNEYPETESLEDELGTARRIWSDYERVVGNLYGDIADRGRVDMAAISKTVDQVVGSIMRNPDACMLLTAVKRKDRYSYSHAMASSILAAAMGRQIGLPIDTIKNLAKGALLCDVGKLKVSSAILNKSAPLTAQEIDEVREHVAQGLGILANSADVGPEILAIVANHHERLQGQGYPQGIKGNQIPPLARIAGIVDCYDAMISDRAYAAGVSPADAISKLYTMRDIDFQAELIEEFIQTVGVFPVGSFVELTDGRVGVVVTEHRRRRLRPRLLLVLDSDKQPVRDTRYINLLEETHDAAGRPLEILKSLTAGAYGIDPDDLLL